jgi:predicted transcriptional regulator
MADIKEKKKNKFIDDVIINTQIPGKRSNKAGFLQIPNMLLHCHADIGLTPQTFTALTYLMSYAFNDDNTAFPSIQNSAAPDLGMDRTSVDKWVKSLQNIDVAEAMKLQANKLVVLSEKEAFDDNRYAQRIIALINASKKVEKLKIKGLINKQISKRQKRGRANIYTFDNLNTVLTILAKEFDKQLKV